MPSGSIEKTITTLMVQGAVLVRPKRGLRNNKGTEIMFFFFLKLRKTQEKKEARISVLGSTVCSKGG